MQFPLRTAKLLTPLCYRDDAIIAVMKHFPQVKTREEASYLIKRWIGESVTAYCGENGLGRMCHAMHLHWGEIMDEMISLP